MKDILEAYKNGDLELESVIDHLKDLPYENLEYARVDHHRKLRSGFAEVIFAQGKTPAQVAEIAHRLYDVKNPFLRQGQMQNILRK